MLKLASDGDVHGLVVAHLHEYGGCDLVRVQDALPEGTLDPDVLEWAAGEGRILLTNDRRTMIAYASERVRSGKAMPGLIVMPPHHWEYAGQAWWDVYLIASVCLPEELRDRIVFLPLKPGDLPYPSAAPEPPSLPGADAK
jgi:hypothetical protein